MDEQEKIERLREIRLIITEVLMFVAVVALVGVLTLVVMGYSFNLKGISREDEELVERTGLVQISSLPTGATITLDGEVPLLLRTNGSRTMRVGEHTITLSREGYDTWEKTVTVSEGMMYRINYPRLFLKERETETVLELKPAEAVAVSPNKEKMLVVQEGGLYYIELNSAKPVLKPIVLKDTEGNVVKITTLTGVEWSGNSERVLGLLNGKRVVFSVRSTADVVELAGEYREVTFETEAGERLLLLRQTGELVEFDLRTKSFTALAKNVVRYDNDGDRILYLTTTKDQETEEEKYEVRALRIGAAESYLVRYTTNPEAQIRTMRYFEDTYYGILDAGKLKVYYSATWADAEWGIEKVFEAEVGENAGKLEKRGKGMVFALETDREGGRYAEVFDIEAMKLTGFMLTGKTGWIDEYLRFVTRDGKLEVVDYDGLNQRVLTEEGVDAEGLVTISGNSRYLYYFTTKGVLVREKIN